MQARWHDFLQAATGRKGWLAASIIVLLIVVASLAGLHLISSVLTWVLFLAIAMGLAYRIRHRHPTVTKLIVIGIGAFFPAYLAGILVIGVLCLVFLPALRGGYHGVYDDMGGAGILLFLCGITIGLIVYAISAILAWVFWNRYQRRATEGSGHQCLSGDLAQQHVFDAPASPDESSGYVGNDDRT